MRSYQRLSQTITSWIVGGLITCLPFSALAGATKIAATRAQIRTNSVALSASQGPENNLRIFPLKAYHGGLHLGYERAIAKKVVIGLEGSHMHDYDMSMFYFHNAGKKYRESFVGLLAQYYFDHAFQGFYAEGGMNYERASVQYHEFGTPEESAQEASENYAYPHASFGYKALAPSGFTFGLGLGYGVFLGKTLYLPGTQQESAFVANRSEFRLRIDAGYAF